MFNNLSIRKKLYFGIFSIVAIIIFLLAAAYQNLVQLTIANGWDKHTFQVLLAGAHTEQKINDLQTAHLKFIVSGNYAVLKEIDQIQAEIQQSFKVVRALTIDNPVQQARLTLIETEVRDWIAVRMIPRMDRRRDFDKKLITADRLLSDPILTEEFKRIQNVRKLLDVFDDEEQKLLNERTIESKNLRERMSLLLIMGGIACVVLATWIAITLARAILKPLENLTQTVTAIAAGDQSARAPVISNDELGQVTQEFNRMASSVQSNHQREVELTDELKSKVDALLVVVSKGASGDMTAKITVTGSDAIGQLGNGLNTMFENLRNLLLQVQRAGIQVTTSTTEIAASARQQEATGVEQAQTTVEVLSTTKEISANTKQLLKTMAEVTEVAEYTTTATGQAQLNLKRMDDTMQNMVNATDSINAKLAALSEKASNINNVLVTITKVADQTNILSLNAAIEAEKAGDAGRGFSVVATEIRRLSDQTSVATWDIEQMLKEMQSAVSASVMGMDKFSDEIRRSVGEVRQVSEQLTSVILQVQQLPPRFDAVLEGMQSQSIGASQITETMVQLSDASKQTVDTLKATSDAVNQLQHAARDLQSSVAHFSVND
jgi:methyl-accepting chemotaxis protein WspA